jgi:signal transduction histidine kinase
VAASLVAELHPLIESLRRMVDGLRRSFDSQKEFIANAAHELKTPVTIQKSTLQLLLHHDLSAAEYKQGLQQALQDTTRIEDLWQRLLRLARAEHEAAAASGRDLRRVDLASSCEAAVAQMQPYAESRGIILQLDRNGSASVDAEPDDLMVIWTNLLENAIRFSPERGIVALKINARADAQGTVTIQDHGCGIAPEERIFERFYRGDVSRARYRRCRVGVGDG